jgi:hypothetical protein
MSSGQVFSNSHDDTIKNVGKQTFWDWLMGGRLDCHRKNGLDFL